jgi:hypothetical protein
MAWQNIVDAIEGKRLTLGGVSGTVHSVPGNSIALRHVADARGKRSKAYLEIKATLRDDYDTQTEENSCAWAIQILGASEVDRLAVL